MQRSAAERKARMLPEEVFQELSDLYKMFADRTRIRILYVLQNKEMCVSDIAQQLDMTQSAISHQLSTLKQGKLVKSRRDGKTIFYSLDDEHVEMNAGKRAVISRCFRRVFYCRVFISRGFLPLF